MKATKPVRGVFARRVGRRGSAMLAVMCLAASVVFATALPASADTASISGTVTNANGDPLPQIAVFASDSTGRLVSSESDTDANGHYTLSVSAGTYFLLFQDRNHALYSSLLTTNPITLNSGDAISNVDATLVVTSISGTVTGPGNVPLADVGVYAYTSSSSGSAVTDSDGHYTIGALQSGTYQLQFDTSSVPDTYLPQWWNNQPDQSTAQGISLSLGQSVSGYDAVLALRPDTISPFVGVTTPADGAQYTLDQVVDASYSCFDSGATGRATGPIGGSGETGTCTAPVADGAPINTSTAGTFTFTVTGTDAAGNTTSTSATYTVHAGDASQAVSGGSVVSTDPGNLGPTPTVPVQTEISVPGSVVPGLLTITPQPTGAPPGGYEFLGQQLALSGPVANAADPYVVTFTIDASALAGTPVENLQVFRNGVVVANCTDAARAVPDPCIAGRALLPNGTGDAVVTVRTSQFSTWNIGRRVVFQVSGFFAPVDNPPTINTVKAGSAVPVKFGLGGNRGLDIFMGGAAGSASVVCGSGPDDPIEQTISAGASSLSYDSGSGRYQYVWKTDKSWKGCRDLVLNFVDGSSLRARFSFK